MADIDRLRENYRDALTRCTDAAEEWIELRAAGQDTSIADVRWKESERAFRRAERRIRRRTKTRTKVAT